MAPFTCGIALLLAIALQSCNSEADVRQPEDSTDTAMPAGTVQEPADSSVRSPAMSPDGTDSPASGDEPAPAVINIRVTTPTPGQHVAVGGFRIAGTARTFENNVSYRINDSTGTAMAGGNVMSQGEMGQFNPFEARLHMRASYSGPATLEVFQISAKDGSEIDKVTIPVIVG